MTGRRRLALILGASLLALSLIVLAGRAILAGTYHRAAIERLASRVAGQRVTIQGPIKLTLIPEPQLIAGRITIGNPQAASVRAQTLKLDLAAWPLLLGQLRATRLTLHRPIIDLPWPLPGGASALAPPPWLASLHASIENGTINLGRLHFTNANLSIFTGGPNAVLALGGSALLGIQPVHLTLDLSHASHPGNTNTATNTATMTASISRIAATGQSDATMNFTGQFNNQSVLIGTITGQATIAPQGWQTTPTHLHATLHADGRLIALSDLTIQHGPGRITGSAQFQGTTAALDLTVDHLNIAPLLSPFDAQPNLAPNPLLSVAPILVTLHLHHARYHQVQLPDLTSRLRITQHQIQLQALRAHIAGGQLSLTGSANNSSPLTGQFTLTAPHLASAITAALTAWRQLDPTLPPWLAKTPWSHAPLTLNGNFALSAHGFRLSQLHGLIGTGAIRSDFTGALTSIGADRAIGLQFGHLALGAPPLAPLIAASAVPTTPGAKITLRLTAQTIAFGPGKTDLTGSHLLIDGTIGRSINLRIGGVTLAGAMINAHGQFSPLTGLSHAQLTIAGPNASSTVLTLDPNLNPNLAASIAHAPLGQQRFALGVRASGPLTALMTQWHLDLGLDRTEIAAAADQRLNLTQQTAQGSLVLRAPSAIALLDNLGIRAGGVKAGLSWPGAGSVGLRIGDHLSPHIISLDNAVASFGASTLTARLKLALAPTPTLTGRLHADRLALPASARLIDSAMGLIGRTIAVQFTADHVERAGATIATNVTGQFSARTKTAPTLAVTLHAAPALGGALTLQAKLVAPPQQQPHVKPPLEQPLEPHLALGITLKGAPIASLTQVAAQAGLHLPFIGNHGTGGHVDLVTALTATGTSSTDWLKSATGSLAITADHTALAGINLTAAAAALRAARAASHRISRFTAADRLRRALAIGATHFSTGQMAVSVAAQQLIIDYAHFAGPSGAVRLSGTINRATSRLNLTAQIQLQDGQQPVLPTLNEQILGTATAPWHHANLTPAMRWIDAPAPPKP
jgi:hypothetical protein